MLVNKNLKIKQKFQVRENIINGNPSSEYDKICATKITNKEKKVQLSQADEEYLRDKQQLSDQFHKTMMQIEGVNLFYKLD